MRILCIAIILLGVPAAARAGKYPRAELDRPAVLPLGVIIASLDAETVPARPGEPEHVAASSELAAGLPRGSELRLGYAQPLDDAGPTWVTGSAALRLYATGWLDVSARSTIAYDSGARRWGPWTSGVRVAVQAGKLALWLRPEQVTLDGGAAPRITVPVSAGVQLLPTLWLQVDGDFHVAELVDDRLLRRAPGPLPVGLAASTSVTPRLDLRARIGGDVGERGVITPTVGWSLGLAYILGG